MPRTKKQYPGVFQTEEGNFGYRFVVTVGGHQKTRKKVKDENGNPFKTRIQAANARTIDIEKTKAGVIDKPVSFPKVTVSKVYTDYRKKWNHWKSLYYFIKAGLSLGEPRKGKIRAPHYIENYGSRD